MVPPSFPGPGTDLITIVHFRGGTFPSGTVSPHTEARESPDARFRDHTFPSGSGNYHPGSFSPVCPNDPGRGTDYNPEVCIRDKKFPSGAGRSLPVPLNSVPPNDLGPGIAVHCLPGQEVPSQDRVVPFIPTVLSQEPTTGRTFLSGTRPSLSGPEVAFRNRLVMFLPTAQARESPYIPFRDHTSPSGSGSTHSGPLSPLSPNDPGPGTDCNPEVCIRDHTFPSGSLDLRSARRPRPGNGLTLLLWANRSLPVSQFPSVTV